MAPISVHFALGVLGALAVPRAAKWRAARTGKPWGTPDDWRYAAWGSVAGTVLPDTDLIVSSLASVVPLLLGGSIDTTIGKSIHRTFTHSYVICALLLAIAFFVARGQASGTRRRRMGVWLGAVAMADVLFHITPDLFYLVDVRIWWPLDLVFTGHLVGVHLGSLTVDNIRIWTGGDTVNNVINGIDFWSETATWLFTWWLARRWGLLNGWIKILPWAAVANFVLYLALTWIYAAVESYDKFLVVIYTPGILNLAISTIVVPIAARETWKRLGTTGKPAGAAGPVKSALPS